MAIDYKRYLEQAQKAGQMGSLTPEQMQMAQVNPEYGMGSLRVQGSMKGAQTPEQKLLAQTTLQQLQSSYAPVLNMQGQPIRWEGENAYQQMLNNYLNRGPFAYDPSKDAGFSAYKKAMLREGDRAQENTLGKTAAMTGGVPSSWAVTAAGQAGNYHASKIADALPNFRQIALQNYLQEGQQDLKDLQVLGGERDFAYRQILNNYRQALDLWNAGQRSKELADILGIEWVEPQTEPVGGYGGGGSGNKTYNARDDELTNMVQNLLDNAASGGSIVPSSAIQANQRLTPEEKKKAQEILNEYIKQGYMR